MPLKAFWCSLIGHVASFITFFALGFVFSNYLLAALLIGIALVWVVQTILFQVFARTQNEILGGWRAGVLSFVVILADFLIASPVIGVVQLSSHFPVHSELLRGRRSVRPHILPSATSDAGTFRGEIQDRWPV